jgi:hypothetical protein
VAQGYKSVCEVGIDVAFVGALASVMPWTGAPNRARASGGNLHVQAGLFNARNLRGGVTKGDARKSVPLARFV